MDFAIIYISQKFDERTIVESCLDVLDVLYFAALRQLKLSTFDP